MIPVSYADGDFFLPHHELPSRSNHPGIRALVGFHFAANHRAPIRFQGRKLLLVLANKLLHQATALLPSGNGNWVSELRGSRASPLRLTFDYLN